MRMQLTIERGYLSMILGLAWGVRRMHWAGICHENLAGIEWSCILLFGDEEAGGFGQVDAAAR